MQQIDDRNLSKRSTHLGRSTISITSDVVGFLGYEGPLRSKTGRGETLRLYLMLFLVWWRFQHLIKIMADVENILNDDGFFGDIIDTPKEGIGQHRKQECLKSVIGSGKA